MDINFSGTTGKVVTAQLYNGAVAVGTSIPLAEIATTGEYATNVPAGTAASRYLVVITSAGAKAGSGLLDWDGTAEIRCVTNNAAIAAAVKTAIEANGSKLDIAMRAAKSADEQTA